MINKPVYVILFFSFLAGTIPAGCKEKKAMPAPVPENVSTIGPAGDHISSNDSNNAFPVVSNGPVINGNVSPDSVLDFARTLIGVPYLYASTDPAKGFDCSGFITYVFNHFKITVPRSSVDFTNYGTEIPVEKARPGDLILFTGTDSAVRVVGHMGIVENIRDGQLHFIHSSSGKALGVVITPFEKYYQGRFVKVIRVFPDESFR